MAQPSLDSFAGKPSLDSFATQQQSQSAQPQQSLADQIWGALSAPANYLKSSMESAASAGADQINQGVTSIQNGAPGDNPIVGGTEAALKVGSGIASVISSPLAGLFKPVGAAINATGNAIGSIPAIQKFAQSPAGQTTSRVAGDLANAGNIAGTILGADQAVKAVPQAVEGFKDIGTEIKNLVTTSPEVQAAKLSAKETTAIGNSVSQISDTIAPKLTAKETKLALAEGRIAPGTDPGILRDGTPDQVLPSTAQAKAAFTIHQEIPGAADLSAPELYTALDDKIGTISKQLRPTMDATPITEDTITKLVNDYQVLKEKQLADPYTPTTANLEKLQANFEQNFLNKTNLDNMGNLWDTRIKYDNSVPLSVKNANSLSSETLQAQKSIWLQNRGILNNAINDASSGLGDVSQKAFSTMSDMYNAQRGIQSSYRVPKVGEASLAKQFVKNHPVVTGAVKAGAKAVGLGAGVHIGEGLIP